MRYQVFNSQDATSSPAFSAPWKWLAEFLAEHKSSTWRWCRVVDSRSGDTVAEWASAILPRDVVPNSTRRKGKSMAQAAIEETGARPGEMVEIDIRSGQARILGRRPELVVDNSKSRRK